MSIQVDEDFIFSEIEKKIQWDNICNVVIAGPSCSGKSSLAKRLQRRATVSYSATILPQDLYFLDLKDIPQNDYGYMTESIHAFACDEFLHSVEVLFSLGSIVVPVYDIAHNKRISKTTYFQRMQLNIFEGLHAIQLFLLLAASYKNRVNPTESFLIYVDTNIDVCLERRVERDQIYNIPEDVIRRDFKNRIMPAYMYEILPQRNLAEWRIQCN